MVLVVGIIYFGLGVLFGLGMVFGYWVVDTFF